MLFRSPKREDMAPDPRSPYAASKLAGERLCQEFAQAGRVEAVALRFFNVFGPRQSPDGAYAAAMPVFMQRALAGRPLTIFGDGGQTRDIVFVKDVVAANAFAATAPGVGGVYNVGYGGQITVLDLARRIVAQAGSRSEILHAPERAGDVRHSRASVEKIHAAGFRPVSSLDAGIAATLDWMRGAGLAAGS